jgi:hypothetical protein
LKRFLVHLAHHLRDHDGGDAVADHAGQRPPLAHDPVDAHHEGEADRDRRRGEELAAEGLE